MNKILKFDEPHYIYLIQTEEFINENRQVYKFGKTSRNPHSRFTEYKCEVKIFLTVAVYDCTRVEDIILAIFKTRYKRIKGNEYFEGDVYQMMQDIFYICTLYGNIRMLANSCDVNIPSEVDNVSPIYQVDNIQKVPVVNQELYNNFKEYIFKNIPHRSTAYMKAAKGIYDHPTKIRIAEDAKDIPGIGPKISKIIDDNFLIHDIPEPNASVYKNILTSLGFDPSLRNQIVCEEKCIEILNLYSVYNSSAKILYRFNKYAFIVYKDYGDNKYVNADISDDEDNTSDSMSIISKVLGQYGTIFQQCLPYNFDGLILSNDIIVDENNMISLTIFDDTISRLCSAYTLDIHDSEYVKQFIQSLDNIREFVLSLELI